MHMFQNVGLSGLFRLEILMSYVVVVFGCIGSLCSSSDDCLGFFTFTPG